MARNDEILEIRAWFQDFGESKATLEQRIESLKKADDTIEINGSTMDYGLVQRTLRRINENKIVLKEDAMFLIKEYVLSQNIQSATDILKKNQDISQWLNQRNDTQLVLKDNVISPGLFDDCVTEIMQELANEKKSAEKLLDKVNSRAMGQPYINLTDKPRRTDILLDKKFLKKYEEQGFESLYFRTDKLELTSSFADQVNKAVEKGVKEIIIFCSEEHSRLSGDELNKFLEDNKIKINFKVVQLSRADFKQTINFSKAEDLEKLNEKIDDNKDELNRVTKNVAEVKAKIESFMWGKLPKLKTLVKLEMQKEELEADLLTKQALFNNISKQSAKSAQKKSQNLQTEINEIQRTIAELDVNINANKGILWNFNKKNKQTLKSLLKKEQKLSAKQEELTSDKESLEKQQELFERELEGGLIHLAQIFDNEITYQEGGFKHELLNNDDSDQIISDNYNEYKQEIADQFPFEKEEPNYIKSATDPAAKKRFKNLSQNTEFSMERTREREFEVNKELNKAKVRKQAPAPIIVKRNGVGTLYNREEAKQEAIKLVYSSFYRFYTTTNNNDLKEILQNLGKDLEGIIDRLFDSSNKINFVTEDVLKLIIQNYSQFQDGIVLSNLPIGLVFDEENIQNVKQGVLFVHKDRPSDMPVNDLTVKLEPLSLDIHPLQFSWLYWASEGKASLDDLFGTDKAPSDDLESNTHKGMEYVGDSKDKQVYCEDDIQENNASVFARTKNGKLDLPANKLYSEFVVGRLNANCNDIVPFFKDFHDNPNLNTGQSENIDGVNFYGLSNEDKARLINIKKHLKDIGLLETFSAIIETNYVYDASFLLKEEAAKFFDELFITLENNTRKTDFFNTVLVKDNFANKKPVFLEQILSQSKFTDGTTKPQIDVKDVFEAVDVVYEEMRQFCRKNAFSKEECSNLENQYKGALKNQIKGSSNFKTIAQRFRDLLDNVNSKGGNIGEQLELLSDKNTQGWLQDPAKYSKLRSDYNIKTIHHAQKLDSSGSTNAVSHKEELKNKLKDPNQKDLYKDIWSMLTKALGEVSSSERASIDTYEKFISQLEAVDNPSLINCVLLDEMQVNDHFMQEYHQRNHPLRTVEYMSFKAPEEAVTDMTQYSNWKENKNKDLNDPNKNRYQVEQDIKTLATKTIQEYCYPPIAVKGTNANLVTGFTTAQAVENVKLLALNILGSIGKNYDAQQPDQDFDSYISLFRVLFSNVMNQDVKIAESKLKIGVDGVKVDTEYESLDSAIKNKENLHKNIIDELVNIYDRHAEFSFTQVVFLGLLAAGANINNTEQDLANLVNISSSYHYYTAQMLRTILSIPVSFGGEGSIELQQRALAAQSMISTLFSTVTDAVNNEQYIVHELLTNNGQNPENLQFFALCFTGQNSAITHNNIKILLERLTNLDIFQKNELLESFAKRKLPYDHGKIVIGDNLATISLDDLKNVTKINDIINANKDHYVSKTEIAEKIRFNKLGNDTVKNKLVNLSNLEAKYGFNLPEQLHRVTFRELELNILDEENQYKEGFIKDVVLSTRKAKINSKLIQDVSFDLIKLMFETIEKEHFGNWRKRVEKELKILFSNEKSLKDQFSYIETNKKHFNKIFEKCANDADKETLLDHLLQINDLGTEDLQGLLVFLENIGSDLLQNKGDAIWKLVSTDSAKYLVANHLELFKFTADFYLEFDVTISLENVYSLVKYVTVLEDDVSSAKKILSYCMENKDYSMIEIFTKLQYKLDNVKKLTDWFTTLSPSDVKTLNEDPNLDFSQLFRIGSAKKIEVLTDIAIKLLETNDLSLDQYNKIVKQVTLHDVDYAKLLSSYLFAPSSDQSSNGAFTTQEKINIVINNLGLLKIAQKIFSEHNLWRLDFDQNKLAERIDNIKRKNTNNSGTEAPLLNIEKQELLESALSVYNKVKAYTKLNSNELTQKSLELKNARSILHDSQTEEIRKLDLEFVSLMMEVMYRTTGKFPRDVQLLDMLNSVLHEGINIMQELATGEGKSVVAALHAAYLTYKGHTVDIATSSDFLASEGLHEFAPFYDGLGVQHSLNIIKEGSEFNEYIKGGINYGTASNFALDDADRSFYAKDNDVRLKVYKSLVIDEVDYILLTSANVHYKLSMPFMNIIDQEMRSLFKHILAFTRDVRLFKENDDVSADNDVENLKMYLKDQLQQFNRGYSFDMNDAQLDELRELNEDLYFLYMAYQKCQTQGIDTLFDNFLNAAVRAEALFEKSTQFVLPPLDPNDDAKNYNLQALPLIGPLKAPQGVYFGEGVQAFLHLMLEEQNPSYENRLKMPKPTSAIFDITPKVYVNSYSTTGGEVVGMTGTAGNTDDLEEFRTKYKFATYKVPRFADYQGVVEEKIVENQDKQYETMLKYINQDSARPIIVFCDTNVEAVSVFEFLKSQAGLPYTYTINLIAASNKDTITEKEAVTIGGEQHSIIITTPMLGRGADWYTEYDTGFLGINLAEHVTNRDLYQIYGRVARNGHDGTMISLFNKEEYPENTIEEHRENIEEQKKLSRERSEPISDILDYFNKYNQGDERKAIECNRALDIQWKKLLDENDEKDPQDQETILQLRDKLVKFVEVELGYSAEVVDGLKLHLDNLDKNIPQIIDNEVCGDTTCKTVKDLDWFEPVQEYEVQYVTQDMKSQVTVNARSKYSNDRYKSTHIDSFEKPTQQDTYQAYYNSQYKYNLAVTFAHVFNMQDSEFTFVPEYYMHLSEKNERDLMPRWVSYIPSLASTGLALAWNYANMDVRHWNMHNRQGTSIRTNVANKQWFWMDIRKSFFAITKTLVMYTAVNKLPDLFGWSLFDNSVSNAFADNICVPIYKLSPWSLDSLEEGEEVIYADGQKLYYRTQHGKEVEIGKSFSATSGSVSKTVYNNLVTRLMTWENPLEEYQLSLQEKKAVLNIALENGSIDLVNVKGDDIENAVMMSEFKKSFESYMESIVNEAEGLVNKTIQSKSINKVNNLVKNFVNIKDLDTTKLKTGSYQAIEITTNDNFDCNTEVILTDGKVLFWANHGLYPIAAGKDIGDIKTVLDSLKKSRSLSLNKVYTAISSLVADPDKPIIETETAADKYCSWHRNQEILKAMAVVVEINDDLSKFLEPENPSLKNLKNVKLLQAVKDSDDISSDFANFVKIIQVEKLLCLLDQDFEPKYFDKSQENIEDTVVSHDVVIKLTEGFADKISQFDSTKYETYARNLLQILELESALDSTLGWALQNNDYYMQDVTVSYPDGPEDTQVLWGNDPRKGIKTFLAESQKTGMLKYFEQLGNKFTQLHESHQAASSVYVHEFIKQITDNQCYIYDEQDLNAKWNVFDRYFGNCLTEKNEMDKVSCIDKNVLVPNGEFLCDTHISI